MTSNNEIEIEDTPIRYSAAKLYAYSFGIIILLQTYLPSFKANVVLQIVILFFCFIFSRVSFSPFFLKQLSPLFFLIVLGFAGTLLHNYETHNIVRDISHLIKPITGLLIGYIFFKQINNFKLFVKTIVVCGLISSVIHFLIIMFLVDTSAGSIVAIREFTRDNFLDLYALFMLLYYRKSEKEPLFKNKLIVWGSIAILALSSLLYFSRTMFVLAIIIVLTFQGYSIITKKTLRFIGLVVLSIGLLYAYLYSINIQRGGRGIEAFFYKVKIAPEEIFKSQVSLANKKALWDHWRGYEASRAMHLMEESPSSYVFGTGIGSLVNLKFYAPLTDDFKGIKFISELHNGYAYVIYKLGYIGLLVYIFILGRWYMFVYKERTFINILISATGFVYFFTSLTITGLYNNRDIIVFILGGLLLFYERQQSQKIEEKERLAASIL